MEEIEQGRKGVPDEGSKRNSQEDDTQSDAMDIEEKDDCKNEQTNHMQTDSE